MLGLIFVLVAPISAVTPPQAMALTAPAPVTWVAPGSGYWDTAANWSTGSVPGPTDDVFIDIPHDATVTVRSGGYIHSLYSRNPLVISGGGVIVDTASTIDNRLLVSGGWLQGGGDLTVNGLFEWTGGALVYGHAIARGGLSISGPESKGMDRYTLDNLAMASWRDGPIDATS